MIYKLQYICFHKRSTWAFPHPLAPAPVPAPRHQGDRLENQIAQGAGEKTVGKAAGKWRKNMGKTHIWKCMEYIYIFICMINVYIYYYY